MAMAFFMWSTSPATDEHTVAPMKPKARRSLAAKSSQPKRPPQRGLGVAQLERLRLQERWRKITDPAAAGSFIGNDINIFSPAFANAAGYGGGTAPRDQYAMDRMRISEYAPPAVLAPKLELPSNQMPQISFSGGGVVMTSPPGPAPTLQCVPDHCEFCIRKKRMLEEVDTFRGGYAAMSHSTTFSSPDQVNMNVRDGADDQIFRKYYDFFPENVEAAGINPEGSRTTVLGHAANLPAAATVDLTLKLSI